MENEKKIREEINILATKELSKYINEKKKKMTKMTIKMNRN